MKTPKHYNKTGSIEKTQFKLCKNSQFHKILEGFSQKILCQYEIGKTKQLFNLFNEF